MLSRTLFHNQLFYMPVGRSKPLMKELIVGNGGGMQPYHQAGITMCLVDKDDVQYAPQADVFYSQYIIDCLEKNELLDKEKYRVPQYREQIASSTDLHTPAGANSSTASRKKFSYEDDEKILTAVNQSDKSYKGEALWRQMERERITDHSWQSMKNRYINSILPIVSSRKILFNPRSKSADLPQAISQPQSSQLAKRSLSFDEEEIPNKKQTQEDEVEDQPMPLHQLTEQKKNHNLPEKLQNDQIIPETQPDDNIREKNPNDLQTEIDDTTAVNWNQIFTQLCSDTNQHLHVVIHALNLFDGDVEQAKTYLRL